jgi:hypothetical protein
VWVAPAKRSLVLGHVAIHVEHTRHFFGRFLLGRVRSVAFLPQKFHRAQKRTRALFPAQHVGPLVDQDRQITVRLQPLGVHRSDDHFRGRPDREALGEFLSAAFGHPSDFRRETLDVLGFTHEQRFGDQQREVGVLVAGLFEPAIELRLQPFPHSVPVGTQDEATADGRLRDQLRAITDRLVPLGEVSSFGWDITDEFGHDPIRFSDAHPRPLDVYDWRRERVTVTLIDEPCGTSTF